MSDEHIGGGLIADAKIIEGEETLPTKVDLGSRFTDWRTLLSFGLALLILVFALKKAGVNSEDLKHSLSKANPGFFIGAFVVYYLSFPLRTFRWRMLMHNANTGEDQARLDRTPFRDLMEILYLSWFANCVVPAKLGDVYRAFLVRSSLGISASRTVGTLLAERVLDLVVLFPLLLLAAVLTFHDRLFADATLRWVILGALALGVAAISAALVLWRLGDRVINRLPQKIHLVMHAFRDGALLSFRKDIWKLLALSVLVWSCEGARLFLVLKSLGLVKQGEIGVSAAVFLALGSSVVTTIPFSPGGLGLVDGFLIAAFKVIKHSTNGGEAVAVALLDRIISYLSIVVFGFLVYIFSKKAREALRPTQQPPRADPPPGAASRSAALSGTSLAQERGANG